MTHHARYVEGSLRQFDALKEELGPSVAQKFERFSIDDARELIAMAALKPVGETPFLIAFSSTTTEAQQALLKLLEEPQQGVSFVFLVPYGVLLPTVRSRMLTYPYTHVHQGDALLAGRFLAASGKARSDILAAMLKDDEGVKERVRDFIDGLEAELYTYVGPTRSNNGEVRQGLEDIAKVRDYLRDRSPSVKMLLEHLALCLPKN